MHRRGGFQQQQQQQFNAHQECALHASADAFANWLHHATKGQK